MNNDCKYMLLMINRPKCWSNDKYDCLNCNPNIKCTVKGDVLDMW